MSDSERIVGLRVSARNNYSCTGEQDITTWEETGEESPITQVDVAIGLDEARAEGIERRGYSGMGAGAMLLAAVAVNDEEPGEDDDEEIASLDHPLVQQLPRGEVRRLRRYIAECRRRQVWDGHNHVTVCADTCNVLLARIRQS